MDSSRDPGPATLRHHDAVLGVLSEAGFALPMATEPPTSAGAIVEHALQSDYDYTTEFDYGLDLILDALEARRS